MSLNAVAMDNVDENTCDSLDELNFGTIFPLNHKYCAAFDSEFMAATGNRVQRENVTCFAKHFGGIHCKRKKKMSGRPNTNRKLQ